MFKITTFLKNTLTIFLATLLLAISSLYPNGSFFQPIQALQSDTNVSFKITDFSQVANLIQYSGDASLSGARVRLTPAAMNKAGAMYYKNKLVLSSDKSFSTYFVFEIDPSGSDTPADGFVFILNGQTNQLGASGGGLGYQGINHSLGIEFDTYYNNETDSGANKIGLDTNGSLSSLVQVSPQDNIVLSTTGLKHVWIDYNGSTEMLDVRIATSSTRPTAASLSYSIDLKQILTSTELYAGFSAATGGAFETHDITSWIFDNEYNPINPSTNYTMAATDVSVTTSAASIDEAATITATVKDSSGTVAPGVTVYFSSSLGSMNPSSAVTNASGVATSTLTSSYPSTSSQTTVQASLSEGAYGTVQVTFNPIYVLSFNGNTADSGSVSSISSLDPSTVATIPSQQTLTKDGYEFVCWNDQANGSGTSYFPGASYTLSTSKTLYAQWLNVEASSGVLNYGLNSSAVTLDSGFKLEGTKVNTVVIQIGNYVPGDSLSFTNTATITGSYSAGRLVLSSSTPQTASDFQAAIRSVTFSTSSTVGDRTLTISAITNKTETATIKYNSENGHFYELVTVTNPGISWTDALTTAATRTYLGKAGYLATLTTSTEDTIIKTLANNITGTSYPKSIWLGFKDDSPGSGVWTWKSGPEEGVQFYKGYYGVTPESVNNQYSRWVSGEPNGSTKIQNYGSYWLKTITGGVVTEGGWDDYSQGTADLTAPKLNFYFVEYGGLGTDTLTTTRTITVVPYTVTYDKNGSNGTAPSDALNYGYGASVTVKNSTVSMLKEGYIFDGWNTQADGNGTSYTAGQSFTLSSNTTLYAKWIINQYSLSFNSNGGSSVSTMTQNYATSLTAPTNPTKTGYSFGGWYSDSGLSNAYTFSTMPASSTTLYAKWTINQYSLSFNSNGGSSVSTLTQNYASTVTEPTNPTKTGYSFGGWYSDVGLTNAYTFTTMPAGNMNLYAKWTINDYSIQFNSNGGSSVAIITRSFGTAVSAPSQPTKTGYTFGGWYSDAGLTNAYSFSTMPASNITLYAKWTINSYTVTFISDGLTVDTQTINYGYSPIAPSVTKNGYYLVGWYQNINDLRNYTVSTPVSSNLTLTARWVQVQNELVYPYSLRGTTGSIHSYYISTSNLSGSVWGSDIYTDDSDLAKSAVHAGILTAGQSGYVFIRILDGLSSYASTLRNSITTSSYGTWGGSFEFVGAITTLSVQYNANQASSGSVPSDSTNYQTGSTATILGNTQSLARIGYTFNGWNTASNGLGTSYSAGDTLNLSSNLTLYAKWTINSYSITFDENGGSSVSDITQNYGTVVSAPAQPTKTGYTFGGWYSDSGLTSAYTFSTVPAQDVNLYAKWSINQYTLRFNENGGSTVSDLTQNYASTVTEPSDPIRSGYTFGGWYSDSGLTSAYTFSTVPAQDVNLYAKWTINDYTIQFNSNGGSSVATLTQNYASTVTEPSDPIRSGYTFGGWYNDSGLSNAYTFSTMPASNTTLYAKWTINTYTITFISNGGTNVSSLTQIYNSAVTQPSNPTRTGHTFEGWFSDISLTNEYTFSTMPAGNVNLYAKWTINQYTLSFSENGGSTVLDLTQNYASTVTEPSDPIRSGYTFGGWYSDSGLSNAYTFSTMPASNTTLYAKWTINQYTLSFNENGGSTVTDLTQDYGTAVSAPSNPTKTGYSFEGWYSDSSLTSSYTFSTIAATNLTLYAKWSLNSYTFHFNENGGSAVTDVTQDYGTAVNAPSQPLRTGYSFGGWYSDSGLSNAYTFTTVPAHDVNLYAKWTINAYTITFISNGGSSVSSISQNYNTALSEPSHPTRIGYSFEGWFSDVNYTNEYSFSTMPAGSFSLYAKWTQNSYAFNYVTNGGSSLASVSKVYNASLSAPTSPTKIGYTFEGWYSDSNLTSPYTFTTMPDHAVSVYAKWEINTYTVSFESNGGSSVSDLSQDYGTTLIEPQDPTRASYVFGGWYSDALLTTPYTFTTMPAHDQVLYARWTLNAYTVFFEENGGSLLSNSVQVVGSALVEPHAPQRDGYVFRGWYRDENLTVPFTFTTMPSQNLTLYAKWDVDTYSITYEYAGGTGSNPSSYTILDSVSFGFATREGYQFLGWLLNGQPISGLPKGSTGSLSLQASWLFIPMEAQLGSITLSSLGTDSVEVLGSIKSLGNPKLSQFGYELTDLSTQTLVTGTLDSSLKTTLRGLNPYTTYSLRLFGFNGVKTTYSEPVQFTPRLPDSDNDGIPDARDAFPQDPTKSFSTTDINPDKTAERAFIGEKESPEATQYDLKITEQDLMGLNRSDNILIIMGTVQFVIPVAMVDTILAKTGSDESYLTLKVEPQLGDAISQTTLSSQDMNVLAAYDYSLFQVYPDGSESPIHQLGGQIKVGIGLDQLQGEYDPTKMEVYFYNSDTGAVESMKAIYDPATQSMVFMTEHFSYYILGVKKEDDPALTTLKVLGLGVALGMALMSLIFYIVTKVRKKKDLNPV